jgi:hypothetical protein
MYNRSVQLLSLAFLAVGLTILSSTLIHGGGPLSLGVFLGVAFLAVGVARLWMSGLLRGRRGTRGRRLP